MPLNLKPTRIPQPTQREIPWRDWRLWRLIRQAPQGFGQGEMAGTKATVLPKAETPSLPITSESWFPELYQLMGNRLERQRNYGLDRMMREMRWGLGRQGLPGNLPNVLVNKFLSQYNQQLPDEATRMAQAMELAKLFAPGFKTWWGEQTPLYQQVHDPTRFLERYLNRYWGGGRNAEYTKH